MKIVVDIPDEEYEYYALAITFGMGSTAIRRILNGTPLPKGHGRLKDFDKIEWYGCDFEGRGCIEAKGDCSVCNHANCYAKQVRELPTIIEADEEGAEE